jgi:hypothetical protein
MKRLNFVTACFFGVMAVVCGIVAVVAKLYEWLFVGVLLAVVARLAWLDYKHPQEF